MADKNRRLLTFFRQYNDAFFEGRLEEPKVIQYGKMRESAGETDFDSQGPTTITIHEKLIEFPRLTQIVLLHEMAHLSIVPNCNVHHGMRFQAEILRLFMQGAYEGLL